MTISLTVKISDGIVFASDSASTITDINGQVITVYNNANKLANLFDDLPIGVNTWGHGSIGGVSISTLFKDLRKRFMGLDSSKSEWTIDPDNYILKDVVKKFRDFFYTELYQPTFQNETVKPFIGFYIGGYSANEVYPELWSLYLKDPMEEPILVLNKNNVGINWGGDDDILYRLIKGYSKNFVKALEDVGIEQKEIPQFVSKLIPYLEANVVQNWMPIQDAIDLANFLVETSKQFSRFTPGHQGIGGPTDIAVITKHEGFKWVRRKHFYSDKLNEPHNE